MRLQFQKIGDFFEVFGDGAHVVGKALDIAVTKTRDGRSAVGLPAHSAFRYMDELAKAGHEVEADGFEPTAPSFPKFDSYVSHGDTVTIEHAGFTFTARIEHDPHHGAPWAEEDGHGPVTEWVSRAKNAGELVLSKEGRSCRYYDFAEACRIALRDGWGSREPIEGETAKQRASRAARGDFEILKAWANDEWRYVGVVLQVSRAGIVLDEHAASLWGIEANYPGSDNSYLS